MEVERVRRDFLCNTSQALKMEATFDATSERECSVCYFDLHLSAAGCHHCSPDKYSCLNHAKQFCSCAWGAKFFLLRYDIKDLAILVEALEGKLSAIYRWAKLDLGLALSSYVSKDKQSVSSKDVSLVPSLSSLKEQKLQEFLKPKEVGRMGSKYIKESSTSHENSRKDVILLSDDEGEDSSPPLSQVKNEAHEYHPENLSCHRVLSDKSQDLKTIEGSDNVNEENAGGVLQQIPKVEEKVVIIGLYANIQKPAGSPSCTKTKPDRCNRQKGPRIAKVVRRINCHVEPLEYGVVQSGKFWCDSRAIYPKGTIHYTRGGKMGGSNGLSNRSNRFRLKCTFFSMGGYIKITFQKL